MTERLLPLCLVLPLSLDAAAKLRIAVDPRIELLAALEIQAQLPWIAKEDSPYKQAMRRWFSGHAGHPAIGTLKGMWRNIDGPPGAMLCFSDPPELRPLLDPAKCRSLPAGGADQLTGWVEQVRDFAAKSDLAGFLASQREVHQRMLSDAGAHREIDYAGALEKFFGSRRSSYTLILSPLLLGNFGAGVPSEDGNFDVYSILSAAPGSPESFRELIWHEFGHSFSNPVVEENANLWSGRTDLFAPVKEQMRKRGYTQWRACVIEHVLRACVARIARRELGEPDARRLLKREKSIGFIYIEPIYDRLAEYEADRMRYPNLASFGARLLSVFGELQPPRKAGVRVEAAAGVACVAMMAGILAFRKIRIRSRASLIVSL